MASFDAIILGAGMVGCACARELAQAGLRVAVVDPNGVATAATAAAMGHLVVLDDSPAQLALTAYARSLWLDLRPQLPEAVEYQACGTIWIAADPGELKALQKKQAVYAAAGVEATLLNAVELALAEPNLRAGLAGGLLVPGDSVVAPHAAAAFFFAEAVRMGATFLTGHAAVRASHGAVGLADGSLHHADHIVVATGAEMHLAPGIAMQRRKGQLVLTAPAPGFVQHQLVELGYLKSAHEVNLDSVAFNVQPRASGQVLIGSSRQSGTDDPAIDEGLLTQMLERAYSYMPALAGLPHVRRWTGFRAATPDKMPYIGPTEDPTVWLAMGFEGLGITTAPAAGRMLADHILQRTFTLDPAPYLPARSLQTAPVHATQA